MQISKWVLGIFCIVVFILHIHCSKSQIAQVDFSVKLSSNIAKDDRFGVGNVIRFFPIELLVRVTDKVVALYPNAQLYLKYKMVLLDKQGNVTKDTVLSLITSIPNSFLVTPIQPDTFLSIAPLANFKKNTQYNIVRLNNDTLSVKHYRIFFTIQVHVDTSENAPIIPTVSPNQAERTLDVIIDSLNTNQASYILSQNRNFNYLKARKRNKLNVYLSNQKNNNNVRNV